MGKFDGKRLLELGTNVSSVDIVRYAKSEGAYVIVTDYLDEAHSAAKLYADECAMVSTQDIDGLCALARARKVDSVFCGVSERNILAAKQVADRLGFPFYFTSEQWDTVMNKAKFKELCRAHGVLVPEEYGIADPAIDFPVIVKPVDGSSAAGVHICWNAEELSQGYADAQRVSKSGQVLIEKYIIGQEVSAYFVFVNGEGRLALVEDKYNCTQDRGYTPLPEASIVPSRHAERFTEEFTRKVVAMFRSIGFDTGVISLQGISNDEGIFIFECCFRMTGYRCYRFIEEINGNNYMKLMTDKMITGSADYDLSREDKTMKGKHCCALSLLNGGGTIGRISGCDEVRSFAGVIDVEERYKVGDTITPNGTLRQVHIRVFMVSDTQEGLKYLINKVKATIHVEDTEGRKMLYSDFDTRRMD